MEWRRKVVGEDSDVKEEGEVSNIHPECSLIAVPVDMFAMREGIQDRRRCICRHVCLLFRWVREYDNGVEVREKSEAVMKRKQIKKKKRRKRENEEINDFLSGSVKDA